MAVREPWPFYRDGWPNEFEMHVEVAGDEPLDSTIIEPDSHTFIASRIRGYVRIRMRASDQRASHDEFSFLNEDGFAIPVRPDAAEMLFGLGRSIGLRIPDNYTIADILLWPSLQRHLLTSFNSAGLRVRGLASAPVEFGSLIFTAAVWLTAYGVIKDYNNFRVSLLKIADDVTKSAAFLSKRFSKRSEMEERLEMLRRTDPALFDGHDLTRGPTI